MSGTANIRQGMDVYGSDNQLIGTVEELHGTGIHVNGQHLPSDVIARVAQNRVYLKGTGAQLMSRTQGVARAASQAQGTQRTAASQAQGTQQTAGQVVVPVAEERLSVEKRQAELGEVQVRKTVIEEQQSVPVELMHEEVHVERRDIPDRPISAADAQNLFEGGTIRVPVRGEEAVVSKEAVVTGEVVINKERLTERQEITDTVRKERVDVEENYQRARAGLQQHFASRQGTMPGGRTFEQAEPNYRRGFTVANDPQYAGRAFEEVEPDLRRTHQPGSSATGVAGGAGDDWEHLREEIREGWNRARS